MTWYELERRSVVLVARLAWRAVVAARIGAPKRLRRGLFHHATVGAAVAALGACVVADDGPREEPAAVAALREFGCTHERMQSNQLIITSIDDGVTKRQSDIVLEQIDD